LVPVFPVPARVRACLVVMANPLFKDLSDVPLIDRNHEI
jgi:hypothetical protein